MGEDLETESLLCRAARGDASALDDLLALHRARLKHMVRARMDRRLHAWLDPSDVVQDALAEAWHGFPRYLRRRALPFYPWLRQIAWQRLIQLHRLHIRAQKRSVAREDRWATSLPDHSAVALGRALLASGSSPSQHAARAELCARIREALAKLPERDREVLVLRHVERLSTREVAAVLGITGRSSMGRLGTTGAGSFTGTSSPRTCSSIASATCGSRTSASRGSRGTTA